MSNNNAKNNERIKAVLEIEPIEFPDTTRTALMSTVTLSKYVNTMLRNTFKDYVGCKIYPIYNDAYSGRHPVRCDLMFSLNGDNMTGAKISAFKPVAEGVKAQIGGTKANYTEMISNHNARVRNLNCAEITQDAIDIIHPLLWNELAVNTKETAKAYQDKGIAKEQSTTVAFAANEIITPMISFISIENIWKFLCGKDKKDEYMVTPVRSLASMNRMEQQAAFYNGQTTENYLYQINKINRDDFMDLMNEVGYISRTGNIDCYTETF